MKILLWFGITVALMFVGVMVITTIQFQSAPPRSAFQPFFAELAVEILEQKGKPGLEEFLKQYTRSTGSTSVLLDSTGRDVLTGGYHEFPKPTRPVMFPMFERPTYAPRVAVYKNYTLITYPKKEETFAWWVIPQNLWILGVGILLCFLLAAYLSYPVRNIQRVVEQYG
ncbi:MAG: hypothetical protein LC114_02675, partial [Bryobacterales bacterium]|nr:hypothetical protein [Bryobacterales bacterium]